MRVLLVDNLLYDDLGDGAVYDLQPHAGLVSLVAVARSGGHAAEVLDPKRELADGRLRLDASIVAALADQIIARRPDVVGFTALGCNFVLVIRTAAELKRRIPELPILLGGPQASIVHRETLERFDVFDAIVRHEAEETLLPLLDRLADRRFDDLPGVSYRTPAGAVVCNEGKPLIEDLDRLPMPAYDAYPIAELGLDRIHVEAGRGCPFSCTFCSTATFFGRRYRLKSAARLLAEMDHLHRVYGFVDFNLTHDLFTVNRKKIFEFCEAVQDRSYGWHCSARVDCVDRELLQAMAKAGCHDIYFGIETGSARMQAISCKRLDLALVEPTVELASGLGMRTTTSFITGYPEEEAADLNETLDLAGRLAWRADGKTAGQLHMLTPEPGTALIAQYGAQMRFDGYLTDFNFPLLDTSDERMVEDNPQLFANYYYYPTPLPRDRHIFAIACFQALQQLAKPIVRYLLRAYEDRLSRLIAAADDWRQSHGLCASPVSADSLIAFATARFGADHHLVSLLRYAAAIDRVRSAAKGCREIAPMPRRGAALQHGRRSEILADIHDCPALLAAIERLPPGALLDARQIGPLGFLLVKADAGIDEIATFKLDRSIATLLCRFERPKTYAQFRREHRAGGGEAAWTWSDIRELCQDGILEQVLAA
jgi:radical SAM superfamily enzyme YgiQ (UPF0313 family)